LCVKVECLSHCSRLLHSALMTSSTVPALIRFTCIPCREAEDREAREWDICLWLPSDFGQISPICHNRCFASQCEGSLGMLKYPTPPHCFGYENCAKPAFGGRRDSGVPVSPVKGFWYAYFSRFWPCVLSPLSGHVGGSARIDRCRRGKDAFC
jgi:hypothetical protein